MPKQCSFDGCTFNVYSHGFCQYHQSSRTDAKRLKAIEAAGNRRSATRFRTNLASKKTIKKTSPKRAEINRKKYEPTAKAYRQEIGHCEVCKVLAKAGINPGFKCCNEPQCIHHVKGKATVELLLDKNWWMVSCFMGNNWIEANSKEAEELKLKIPDYGSKLSKFH